MIDIKQPNQFTAYVHGEPFELLKVLHALLKDKTPEQAARTMRRSTTIYTKGWLLITDKWFVKRLVLANRNGRI